MSKKRQGRPSRFSDSDTRTIRVPRRLAAVLMRIAEKMDRGELLIDEASLDLSKSKGLQASR